MTQGLYTILSNRCIAKQVYEMVLQGDTSALRAPGQFINIALDGFFLRRPISVCDYEPGRLTILYKIVGRGTAYMEHLADRATLDILCGLGNGFDTGKSGDQPLRWSEVVQGFRPCFLLAKQLLAEGKQPIAILGFNAADEVFTKNILKHWGFALILPPLMVVSVFADL